MGRTGLSVFSNSAIALGRGVTSSPDGRALELIDVTVVVRSAARDKTVPSYAPHIIPKQLFFQRTFLRFPSL
jgi:hypothetical protein